MLRLKQAIGVLAAALVLAGTSAGAQTPQWAPDLPEAPFGIEPLPMGRLVLVSGNEHGAHFLDLDRSRVAGGVADVWYFTVHVEDQGNRWVQSLHHVGIDCGSRTQELIGYWAFNEPGTLALWLPPEPAEPIERDSVYDFISRVLCDGYQLPAQNVVQGHAAAFAMGRAAIRQAFP